MIEAQVISKLLEEGSLDVLLDKNISSDYFVTYNEEARFIYSHYNEYRQLPSKESFIGRFNEFEFTGINESWDYLTTALTENYMFSELAKLINSSSKVIEDNALSGFQMLKNKITELEEIRPLSTVDIISEASDRLKTYEDKLSHPSNNVINIGLKEMDQKLYGWQMGEELVTVMARTNQGKSWILLEFLMNAWKQGKRVGLYSGEMSAEQIGYRFDALLEHFSNLNLMRANDDEKDKYKQYIEELKEKKNCFVVITPKDLGHLATVNDIDYLIKKNNLDIVGVDQFSLMEDFRSKKGDPIRIRLGNISADLFNLSMKHKIPIIALSQANRMAAKGSTPELEHMSESDAIAQNSTKVLSMSRKGNELRIKVTKNRYGPVGDEFVYLWDIDTGQFNFSRYGEEKHEDKPTDTSLSRNIDAEESPF